MAILSVDNLCKQFAEKAILHDVTFRLSHGERVGLVGANGSGKSTLLKILTGEVDLDSGYFHFAAQASYAHLPQTFEPVRGLTVSEWLAAAEREILSLEAQLTELSNKMATANDEALEQLMDTYGELATRFEQRGGYDLPHRVETILQGLGIADLNRHQNLASLSGGEQVRLGLAAVLIQSPDLLFLDEPTNHLDATSLTWLERYLAAYRGALLVVSHDRYFLNGVVNRILEVDEYDHHLRNYAGNYDFYLAQKRLERQHWETRYSSQQEEITELKQRIHTADRHVGHNRPAKDNNKMAYNRHGANVERTVGRNIQAAELKLARILADVVPRPPDPLGFVANFAADTLHHGVALSVSDLRATLATGKTLYRDVRFTLGRNQRMLITGPNGAGKTTLLNTIAGICAPQDGTVFSPVGTIVGYLRQNMNCENPKATVFDSFREGLPGTAEEHVARLLSYQLFHYDEFRLLCGGLSPGQYRKLMIAKLMASGANLLLLDEPTNHISFSILEEFERAIAEFPGAIIAVSHDRRFIGSFHGKVWTLENTKLVPPCSPIMSDSDSDRMRAEIEDLASYADPVHGRLRSSVFSALPTRRKEI